MKHIILLVIFSFIFISAFAQPPYLLKDTYNGTTSGITTFDRIVLGPELLFVSATASSGAELWKTDGNGGNTGIIKDIAPGSLGSHINGFYTFNNEVFFEAYDGVHGSELWKSDATTNGTVQVKDIRPGSQGGFDNISFKPVWEHDGYFFFLAETNGSFDNELWKSDGTSAGTTLVKDILPGISSSNPGGFYEFNDELYFEANDSIHGTELWKTDGTSNGTVLVHDIRTGSPGGFDHIEFHGVWIHDGNFYFLAETNDSLDSELWKSDGTDTGTVLLKDIYPGSISSNAQGFYEFGNALFFEARDSSSGSELWKCDGSTNVVQVKDIRTGSAGGFDNTLFKPVWVHDSEFFFTAETNDTLDSELWKTDGTDSGTVLVMDIFPGAASSNPRGFFEFNNQLFFSATNGTDGAELWSTDGSTIGTQEVRDILPGSSGGFDNINFQPVWIHDSAFYFTAETTNSFDNELWKSDGTTAGTELLKDIQPGVLSSNPQGFYAFANKLFFEANDGINGAELWKTDGTAQGTVLVKDIRQGSPGGFDNELFSPFIEWFGSIYFRAETNAANDNEIWKSDGTDAGTWPVGDIDTSIAGSNAWGFTILANTYLVFAATNGSWGQEPWAMNMPGLSTGIEEPVSEIHASVFPNPSDGNFTLKIESVGKESSQLNIYDICGKIISHEDLAPSTFISKKIDLTKLEKGIYFLHLETSSSTYILKVMIY